MKLAYIVLLLALALLSGCATSNPTYAEFRANLAAERQCAVTNAVASKIYPMSLAIFYAAKQCLNAESAYKGHYLILYKAMNKTKIEPSVKETYDGTARLMRQDIYGYFRDCLKNGMTMDELYTKCPVI